LGGNPHGAAIDALAQLLLSRGNFKEAIVTAREAIKLAPQSSLAWQVVGWAHYRNGDWKASIEALEKSCALQDNPKGGDAGQWFFLAMAHWQLGEKEKARKWFDQATDWLDKNQPKNEEFRRFRAEAAELMGIDGAKK
jgi:tetratricopeptide (TPR) repeat protein